MLYIFTFSFNPETKEAAYAGNLGLQEALQILQQIIIADAVRKIRENEKREKEGTDEQHQPG